MKKYKALAALTELTELSLDASWITDFSPLANLVNLEHLSIGRIGWHAPGTIDVSRVVASLTKLKVLSLNGGVVLNIKDIVALTALKELSVRGSGKILYWPLIVKMTGLVSLALPENENLDLRPLAKLIHLEELDLTEHDGPLLNLRPLTQLPKLRSVSLHRASVSDAQLQRLKKGLPPGANVEIVHYGN